MPTSRSILLILALLSSLIHTQTIENCLAEEEGPGISNICTHCMSGYYLTTTSVHSRTLLCVLVTSAKRTFASTVNQVMHLIMVFASRKTVLKTVQHQAKVAVLSVYQAFMLKHHMTAELKRLNFVLNISTTRMNVKNVSLGSM